MIPTNQCHYLQPYKNYVIIFSTSDMLELGLSTQEVQQNNAIGVQFTLVDTRTNKLVLTKD